MARYKAPVIFEVHEDEERDGIIGEITEYVQEIGDLLADHKVSSLYEDIRKRTGNEDDKFKTTYKIVSFERLGGSA